ncbi:MAG: carboxypeptidase regulatory-like domain-containing protein, partial [Planctomycetota bacterium]|nr:carboxypeptidase regulatory-like domain-containing protein [Planctomycetota bacterium]
MRKVAVLLVLAVCLVGVLFLLSGTGEDEHRSHHGAAGPGDAELPASGSGADLDAPGRDGRKGGGSGGGSRDDDPNRIDGPDLTVAGIVLRDDAPVEGAEVTLHRAYPARITNTWSHWALHEYNSGPMPGVASVTTGADGRFKLSASRRTRLIVEARAKGAGSVRGLIYIPAEGDPDKVTLRLVDGYRVTGLVVDAKNEPVAGASVVASMRTYYQAPPMFDTATTDAQGRFVLESLTQGWTTIRADADGLASASISTNISGAADIFLKLTPGGSIQGKVTDDQDASVAGAIVRMTGGNSFYSGRGEAETDGDGRYVIANMLPGDLRTVTVHHADFGVRSSASGNLILPARLVRDGEALTYDIKLERGITVRGVVLQAQNEAPVAGAQLMLARMADQGGSHQDVGYATSGADGRFKFDNVLGGSYAIEATAPGLARSLARRNSATQPLTLDFFVDKGIEPEKQRVLMDPMGSVLGKFLDTERDFTNTNVSLVTGTEFRKWSRADMLGHVVFEHVPAGQNGHLQSWNPQTKTDPFVVEAGQELEVELSAESEGGFEGKVEDAQGNPLRGAFVRTFAPNQLSQARSMVTQRGAGGTTTDENGRYFLAIADWARNQYKAGLILAAAHADFEAVLVRNKKAPAKGETTEVNFRLLPGSTISGQVVYADGAPVPNAWVSAGPLRVKKAKNPDDIRQQRTTRSDGQGRFTVACGSGQYNVSASTTEGIGNVSGVEPGTSDVRIEIVVKEFIAGFVIDEESRPVASAQVLAVWYEGKNKRTRGTQTSASGHFRVGYLEKGNYALEVRPQKRNRYYGAQQQGAFEVTEHDPVATGTDDVVIRVSPGAVITGKVVGPHGRPIPAAMVIALTKKKKKGRGAVTAMTNARGEFKLKGVGKDPVEILAGASGHLPASMDAQPEQSGVVIDLQVGQKTELTLHVKGGQRPRVFATRVVNELGRPIQGALVEIVKKGKGLLLGGFFSAFRDSS